tara:strand:+ start:1118 stop:1309 length:192 start_codon:yes stop_codon:yes gene_type:complete
MGRTNKKVKGKPRGKVEISNKISELSLEIAMENQKTGRIHDIKIILKALHWALGNDDVNLNGE